MLYHILFIIGLGIIGYLVMWIVLANIQAAFDQFPDDPNYVKSDRVPSTIFELFLWLFGANR